VSSLFLFFDLPPETRNKPDLDSCLPHARNQWRFSGSRIELLSEIHNNKEKMNPIGIHNKQYTTWALCFLRDLLTIHNGIKVKKLHMLMSKSELGMIQIGSKRRKFFHRSSKIYITITTIRKTFLSANFFLKMRA